MKKVLIVQTAFLGDVVLATALIESLHISDPELKISMLVRDGNQGLLKGHPHLENILIWKKSDGKIKSLFSVIDEVKKQQFETVINLQRFFSSGLITVLSGARIRSGFDKNPLSAFFTHKTKHIIGDGRHEVERNLELLKSIGISVKAKPKLYPSEEDHNKAGNYKNSDYVTMAPASVWYTKQLPEYKWVELIQKTPAHQQIYLIGGPSDDELCKRIISESKAVNAISLAGKLSLLQTASLMRDAEMNYVNDSGPLHLASAMNAPVTAFFCSTVPDFGFGPLSDHSTVVEVKEKLYCRPCGLHGKKSCPEGHFRCGKDIVISFEAK